MYYFDYWGRANSYKHIHRCSESVYFHGNVAVTLSGLEEGFHITETVHQLRTQLLFS